MTASAPSGAARVTAALPLADAASRNGLLSRLPANAADSLLRHAEVVCVGLRERLHEVGQPIDHVYFPVTAVTSIVTVMGDGTAVETATVGSEGLVGLSAVLGSRTATSRAFAQIPGTLVRVPTDSFAAAATREGALGELLRRYTLARLSQVTQTAACNRLHPVDQRCARWLLMTHDRVGGETFQMTQDFLAQMLGVRRASVSTAASELQRRGLIAYSRGRVRVLDRAGLEAAACECYRVVRERQARLLG